MDHNFLDHDILSEILIGKNRNSSSKTAKVGMWSAMLPKIVPAWTRFSELLKK